MFRSLAGARAFVAHKKHSPSPMDTAEVRRAARLAESRGVSTRAVLKILGRSALVLTSAGLALFGWITAGIDYVWLALTIVIALTRRAVYAVGWLVSRVFSLIAPGRNR